MGNWQGVCGVSKQTDVCRRTPLIKYSVEACASITWRTNFEYTAGGHFCLGWTVQLKSLQLHLTHHKKSSAFSKMTEMSSTASVLPPKAVTCLSDTDRKGRPCAPEVEKKLLCTSHPKLTLHLSLSSQFLLLAVSRSCLKFPGRVRPTIQYSSASYR